MAVAAASVVALLGGAPAAAEASVQGDVSFPGPEGGAIYDLAEDGQGGLLAGGVRNYDLLIGRYQEGALDAAFGSGLGYIESSFGPEASARALAPQRDGKIVAAGRIYAGDLVVSRFEPSGIADLSFGQEGSVRIRLGYRGGAEAMVVTPRGQILAAGYGHDSFHHWKAVVVALRANGELDRHFGRSGQVEFTTLGKAPIEFEAMQLTPNGRILLAGEVDGRVLLARLLASGKPDPTFGNDGVAYFDPDGDRRCPCSNATGLALDGRGRAVVGVNVSGPHGNAIAVLRVLPTGALDRSFGRRGVARARLGSRVESEDVAVQRNGKIVSAGFYNVPKSGEARAAVARFQSDGRLDLDFGHRGFFTRDFGTEGVAYAALAQRDGGVVVAGRANREPFEGDAVYETAEPFLIRFHP